METGWNVDKNPLCLCGFPDSNFFQLSSMETFFKTKKKIKPRNVSRLKKDLDAVFSIWIRHRDQGQCFTCSTKKEPKEMQNGHYVSRSASNLRFDEINCHCQCMPCNVWKHGNMVMYSLRMMEKYGPDIIEKLEREGRRERRFTIPELLSLIEKYTLTKS